MPTARTVLRTLTTGRYALSRNVIAAGTPPASSRGISSALLRKPTPDLISRLENKATTPQLKQLLVKAVDAQSPLISVLVDILRKRNKLSYGDYTYIIRDLRNEFSDPERARPLEETREALRTILKDLKDSEGHLDAEGQSEMVRMNVLLGDEPALAAADETIRRWGDLAYWRLYQWNAYLELLILRGDVEGVEGVVEDFAKLEKGDPPIRALQYLVTKRLQEKFDSKSEVHAFDVVSAVDAVEKTTGSYGSTVIWATAIQDLLSRMPDAVDTAMEVYGTARERGVETDYYLARCLIDSLVKGDIPRIEEAFSVYSDYLGFNPQDKTTLTAKAAAASNGRDPTPLFSTLLVANARSTAEDRAPSAIRILNDMRARGLSLAPGAIASTYKILATSAPDHQTAFNIYAHIYALNENAIDRHAFDVILSTFIKLSTDKSPFAPAALYLEIMRDMRKANIRIGSHAITSLLKSYGLQARQTRKSITEPGYREAKTKALLKSILELHTMIKLDPMIAIDIPLLNSLMDAFARVGAYAEAFEVWDELVERRPRENPATVEADYSPSLNIILDACGHSGSLFRGKKAWNWAARWGLNANKKNWDAYVECLCRCGQMEDAFEVVTRMKESVTAVPKASKETVELLVKFSWRNKGDFEWVKERVEKEFPEWWPEMRRIVEKKSVRIGA
jgi:pentatricopeptide repeat protein